MSCAKLSLSLDSLLKLTLKLKTKEIHLYASPITNQLVWGLAIKFEYRKLTVVKPDDTFFLTPCILSLLNLFQIVFRNCFIMFFLLFFCAQFIFIYVGEWIITHSLYCQKQELISSPERSHKWYMLAIQLYLYNPVRIVYH